VKMIVAKKAVEILDISGLTGSLPDAKDAGTDRQKTDYGF